MTLSEIVRQLDLKVLTFMPENDLEVRYGYASDLLSDVLGQAPPGALWVTLQCHPNVIAIASLLDLSAVLLVGGILPDQATLERGQGTGVTILSTELPTFEIVGRLYQLGLRGSTRSCLDG